MYSDMTPLIVVYGAIALVVLYTVLSKFAEWRGSAGFDGPELGCDGFTVSGGIRWSLVSCRYMRRISDHARWVLIEFEARNVSETRVKVRSDTITAFQDGAELDRYDRPRSRVVYTPVLVIRTLLPGGGIRMAQMFRLRGDTPVEVSFDEGATVLPLPVRPVKDR